MAVYQQLKFVKRIGETNQLKSMGVLLLLKVFGSVIGLFVRLFGNFVEKHGPNGSKGQNCQQHFHRKSSNGVDKI